MADYSMAELRKMDESNKFAVTIDTATSHHNMTLIANSHFDALTLAIQFYSRIGVAANRASVLHYDTDKVIFYTDISIVDDSVSATIDYRV